MAEKADILEVIPHAAVMVEQVVEDSSKVEAVTEVMVVAVVVVFTHVMTATEVAAEMVALTVVVAVVEAVAFTVVVAVVEMVATALIQEAVHSATMVVVAVGIQDMARRQQAHVEALADKAKTQPLCRWNLQEQELAEQVLLKVAEAAVVTEATVAMLIMGQAVVVATAATVAMVLIPRQAVAAAMAVMEAMVAKHTISMAARAVAVATVSMATVVMERKAMVIMVKTAVSRQVVAVALPIQPHHTLQVASVAMVEMASVSLPTGNMNNLKQRTKGVD